MGVLERYEQQAVILRRPHRGKQVVTDWEALRDVQTIAGEQQRYWKQIDNDLRAGGDPMALVGFAGVERQPPPGTLPTVTITATEAALWPTATWTPIDANPQCPKAYRLIAYGTSTTAATQGTMLFNARFGQLVTSPLIGASTAAAQTASQTATPWRIEGAITIQKGGTATSGLVVANFKYEQGTAVSGGSAVLPAMEQIFGTTTGAVSVVTDGTTAAGLWMGAIAATSTTNTYIPQSVVWVSYN